MRKLLSINLKKKKKLKFLYEYLLIVCMQFANYSISIEKIHLDTWKSMDEDMISMDVLFIR